MSSDFKNFKMILYPTSNRPVMSQPLIKTGNTVASHFTLACHTTNCAKQTLTSLMTHEASERQIWVQ